MTKKVKEQKEEKVRECYYPTCKKDGYYKYGQKKGYYLLCEEHFHLVTFMRDLNQFFIENI